MYHVPSLPLPYDLETVAVLKQLNRANRKLAELKGVASTIPNEDILVSTLTLQEAKDSSAIENIVTTHDDLFRAELRLKQDAINASAKEVLDYREAIKQGFRRVRERHVLTCSMIKDIQQCLEHNNAGFRAVPGTVLMRGDGQQVYTPPQDGKEIETLMANLECFINDASLCPLDPLIKMAIIHHQFESRHPFYDGNGRTGRIVNVLYLVLTELLDLPILYLSRYITNHKAEYYRLIQAIRDKDTNNQAEWEAWTIFILKGIEVTAEETIALVKNISSLMSKYKAILRPAFGTTYKHELLNNLFFHPYTRVEYIERDMQVKRLTATKYLKQIVDLDLLYPIKVGRSNIYINTALVQLFMSVSDKTPVSKEEAIEIITRDISRR